MLLTVNEMYDDFCKRWKTTDFESSVNDLLSWLWENLDDSKLNNENLGSHDDFNHFLENEQLEIVDIIENVEAGKNIIVKDNGWIKTTQAEQYINELLEKCFFAGVEAAKNEMNQRINEYNESLEKMKEEIEEYIIPGQENNAADTMQKLYSNEKNMSLFSECEKYYIIQGKSKYQSDFIEMGKKAYNKKEINKIVREYKKKYTNIRIMEVSNGQYKIINEIESKAA